MSSFISGSAALLVLKEERLKPYSRKNSVNPAALSRKKEIFDKTAFFSPNINKKSVKDCDGIVKILFLTKSIFFYKKK